MSHGRFALTLVAVALGVVASLALARDGAADPLSLAGVALALVAAALILDVPAAQLSSAPVASESRPGRWRPALGWGLLILALGGIAVAVPRLSHQWTLLLPLWLAALAIALFGAALLGRFGADSTLAVRRPVSPAEIVAIVAIVALGAMLRTWNLEQIPPGIFVDETNAALDALRIHEGAPLSPFKTGWWQTPLLYAYYLAGLHQLGGIDFGTLKLASVLPAIATVAAVYPLVRHLFGVTAAISATLLLAFSRWHLTMSRWGWNELMPPLFHILAAWLLLLAIERRRAWLYVAAGMVLGLGSYTYLSSRLVLLALVAYVAWRSVSERSFLRRNAAGLMLWVVGLALVTSPLAWTYINDPSTFLNRSREVSILRDVSAAGSYAPLKENIERHLLMFHDRGDLNGRHNLPGEPMLDPVTGALFLLGVGVALRHVRDPRHSLLLIWIVVVLAGGILSVLEEGPQAYRTLGVVPAVCALAGAVLAGLVDGVRRWSGRAWVETAIALVALGSSRWSSARTYFDRQASDPGVRAAFNDVQNEVARELLAERASAGGVAHVYIAPDFYHFAVIQYLLYRERRDGVGGLNEPEYHLLEPARDVPLLLPRPHDILFLVERDQLGATSHLVRGYYPGAEASVVVRHGQPLYGRIFIPASDLEALRGLDLVAAQGTRSPAPYDAGAQQLSLDALPAEHSLVGGLSVATTGAHRFVVSGPVDLEIDGSSVAGELVLGSGLHDLRLHRRRGEGKPELLYQPPGAELQPVPIGSLFRIGAPRDGLRGRYFRGGDWSDPAFERVDRFMTTSWSPQEPLPDPFSVRWTGHISAATRGDYNFALQCDDGCALWVGGEVIASRLEPGVHNIAGQRMLEAGDHDIRIDYFQTGGGKSLRFSWAPPGSGMAPVPPEVLRPAPAQGDLTTSGSPTDPDV